MREAWQQTKANHWNNDRYQVITLRQTKISQNAYYKAFLYRLLDFLKKKYNAYGLSPQVGIAYRFQHVGVSWNINTAYAGWKAMCVG